jgi:hypothetical protein
VLFHRTQRGTEFVLYFQGIANESAPYHWLVRNHHLAPTNFHIHAGVFGIRSNALANFIEGVPSADALVYSADVGQQAGVADHAPVNRPAVPGWRNSDANGNTALAIPLAPGPGARRDFRLHLAQ